MNATLRTLLVDDERAARSRLRHCLQGHADIEIVGECGNGREAVDAIAAEAPDLVFLDVQMPELDGLGVIAEIGAEAMPATVFVTAYDQHALAAFDAHAVDYLLKPFDRDRFDRALGRARERLARPTAAPSALDALAGQRAPAQRLLVRDGELRRLLQVEQLLYAQADGNYVRLHSADGCYTLRSTLSALCDRLDPTRFRRIHRSAVVNLDAIDKLLPWFGGDYLVLMRDGRRLTMSRTRRRALADLLDARGTP